MKPYAENRKARFDYETLETFEGGLALTGSEVKSIREGGAKLEGSYVKVIRGHLELLGCHISPYSKQGKSDDADPDRTRPLLVHKKELRFFLAKTAEKGLTLVPFSLYSSGRRIKLQFGLCRGRKTHDKRQKLKERDMTRTVQRHLRGKDEE